MDLSPDELRTLVGHLPYYVVIFDEQLCFAWVNRLDATLDAADVLGKPLATFVPDEDEKRALLEAARRCLEHGERGYVETRGYREGGFDRHFGNVVVRLPDGIDGTRRGLLIVTDVTDRRLAEAHRARGEARFRRLVEASPDWISIVDERGRVKYVNRPPPAESGLTLDDVVGMSVQDLLAPASREHAAAAVERVFAGGPFETFELSGGHTRRHYLARVAAFPPDDTGEPQALFLSSDITAQHEAARQSATMVAELDHRVKNTLAMVVAIAEQTLSRADSLETFREAFMGRIRALASTHETLAASRWGAVRLDHLVPMVLGPLLGEVAIECECGIDPELPPRVVTPLACALHELATNAIKHGPLRSASGRIRLRCDFDEERRLQLTWIEEPGASEPLPRRSGLGLMLVQGLVESELGGRWTLESTPEELRHTIVVPLEDVG